MEPTKQTVLHDPDNGKHGNCLSAVLASLLHVPIETVPVFKAKHPQWQRDLNAWLRPFGLAYLQIGTFDEWCAEVGITGCYHEAAGPTLRSNDVLHACVGTDGAVVFDPHPDDTGLTEVQSSGVFIALEPWKNSQRIAELERELAAIKGQEPVAEVRLLSEQRLVSGADMGLGCSDGYVTDRYLKLRFINYRMHNPDNGVIKDGTKLYALPVAPVADKDAERPVIKESLITEDLTDQKDAARWRYFKYCFDHPMERRELARRLGCRDEEFDPDLDAAIDAAMAKGE